MADSGHIEFGNMLIPNISVMLEDIYIKFGTKMQHNHAQMPTVHVTNKKLCCRREAARCFVSVSIALLRQ